MNFKGNKKFPAHGSQYGDNFESFFEAITDGHTQFMDIPIADEHQNARLKKMVTDNPVAAALVFKNIMEVVLEELLGIQSESKIRKTVPLQCRRKGIFGTTTALFSVTEVQARLTLHAHVCLWGNIPPELMQKAAFNENIVRKVAQVLDSQYAAQFPPVIHVKGMLNRIHRNAAIHKKPSRMLVTTPRSVRLAAFRLDTALKADIVGVHKHTFTCHKGKHGKRCCRVAQPSGLISKTGPVQISCGVTPESPYVVSESIQMEDLSVSIARDRLTHPIPEADKRCIVWEIKREALNAEDELRRLDPAIQESIDSLTTVHKEILVKALAVRNGAVVSFSPVLTQCLGCNTAAILLGSEEQARAALFYLVKYMNKDSVPLGNSLPVIRQVLLHVNRYPSRAADADTDSRTGKYFLERIVNGFTGLAEISDTQSAACQ